MRTIFLILVFFFIFGQKFASSDPTIVKKISDTKNFAFDFEQFINDKKETGNCIISFDNKIICKYDVSGKIIVSNGKTLLIKNKNSNFANTYKTEGMRSLRGGSQRYVNHHKAHRALHRHRWIGRQRAHRGRGDGPETANAHGHR